jgi:hypothetical protein
MGWLWRVSLERTARWLKTAQPARISAVSVGWLQAACMYVTSSRAPMGCTLQRDCLATLHGLPLWVPCFTAMQGHCRVTCSPAALLSTCSICHVHAAGSDPVFNSLSSLYNTALDAADYYNTSEVCFFPCHLGHCHNDEHFLKCPSRHMQQVEE